MRKVSVGLVADVGEFVRGMLGAKKSVDELGDEVQKLDHELDKIPTDAAKASAALKLLGGDVNALGDKVTSLGEKNTGLAVLDAKIKASRTEVKKLADEFVKTGDIDVFKKLGDAEGRLRGLETIRKKLKDALVIEPKEAEGFFKSIISAAGNAAEQAGQKIGGMLPSAVSGALGTPVLGPIIATALLAAIAAAMTIVLANVGGLILAAGGAGIIGGGIMGAIMGDPTAIGNAWGAVLDGLRDDFMAATTDFRGPLIDAAHVFAGVISGLRLDQIFSTASNYLPELVAGAADFTRWIGIAAEYLTTGAGPVMEALAQELPKLGHAIAAASAAIAANGEGGAAAMKDLFNVIEIIIAGLGNMIGRAEQAYASMVKLRNSLVPLPLRMFIFGAEEQGSMNAAARAIDDVSHSALMGQEELDGLSAALGKTVVTADSLAGAMVGKIFAATMGLDQALLGVAESLTKVGDAFEKNGRALDKHTGQVAMNTEKGQANREAVLSAVTANMSLYQAQLSAGMSAEDAAQAYDENTAALEAQLHKAGLTQGAIDGLIGKYRGIPKRVDTDIAINGLTAAIDRLADLIRLINGIHDKTVTVTVKQVGDAPRGQSRGGQFSQGGIRRAASGMIIAPSDPGTILTAEPPTGGEALIPLQGIGQGRAMSLMQQVGNGYGLSVSQMGGGGMPRELVLNATFLDPMSGDVMRRTAIRWSLDRGRSPAEFFTRA